MTTNDESVDSALKGTHGNKTLLCENHFNLGCGPKGALSRLIRDESELRGKTSPNETLSKIPATCQVKGLRESFRKQGVSNSIRNLDLIEWASLCMSLSK